MATHTLTIETIGICTHFTHGVVSGIPHRIVLPDARQIRGGVLALPGQSPVRYYLIPHFPQLEASTGVELTIPGLLSGGDIVQGVRLQVINCIDLEVEYRDERTPRLTQFDPSYSFSGDAVQSGRAACYLDVYGGRVSYVPPPQPFGASSIAIEMHTEGPPELLVTPLAQGTGPGVTAHRLRLGDDPSITLTVKNSEPSSERPAAAAFGAFDYLLHYLTARGGIPESLAQPTPGMPSNPPSVTAEQLATVLRELADLLSAARNAEGSRHLMRKVDLTASCAPSQYP